MKKNVAGQKIGAQMVSATDGSEFTGTVTVYVTGDAGVQAIGTVGSGVCTHEGHGYHTYAPSQAETNYGLIAFTFVGSGAISQTLQALTTFPQTGDAYTRTLAKGTDITGFNDLSAAQVNTEADTALADVGVTSTVTARIDAAVSTRLATGTIATDIAAIGVKTTNLPGSPAAVGSAMTLTSGERSSIADAQLDRADAVETGLTPRQAYRLMTAALAGVLSGAATTTIIVKNAIANTKTRITVTADADGNRSVVVTDLT